VTRHVEALRDLYRGRSFQDLCTSPRYEQLDTPQALMPVQIFVSRELLRNFAVRIIVDAWIPRWWGLSNARISRGFEIDATGQANEVNQDIVDW
jgi:hypothetical protein